MTQLGTEFGPVPSLVGAVGLTVDGGTGSAGDTVIIPARVTNPGADQVRAVLTVQGLSPSWCPPTQVLLLPAGNTAEVFLHLRPAPGTPPGRYLWALTVQTAEHPLQAVTSELLVCREPVPVKPRPRRSRRRLLVAAGALLSVIVAVVVVLTREHHAPEPKPVIHQNVSPEPQPSAVTAPPVALTGTILAGDVGVITVAVVRLTLDDLSDQGHATGLRVKAKVTITGKQWTTSLPAGVYGMTFTQKGYEPASIVVDTTVLRWAPPPWVQLLPVSGEQETGGD